MHGTVGVEDAAALFLTEPCWELAASGSHPLAHSEWDCTGCALAVIKRWHLSVLQCCTALGHICSIFSHPRTALLIPLSWLTHNTLCVLCSGHKSSLQRNLCETSLRNSTLMSQPEGWRFSEITANQLSWLVAILIKIMYINDHLNSFLPKSLQKVSLSLLVCSIPLEQPMRQ